MRSLRTNGINNTAVAPDRDRNTGNRWQLTAALLLTPSTGTQRLEQPNLKTTPIEMAITHSGAELFSNSNGDVTAAIGGWRSSANKKERETHHRQRALNNDTTDDSHTAISEGALRNNISGSATILRCKCWPATSTAITSWAVFWGRLHPNQSALASKQLPLSTASPVLRTGDPVMN